MVNCRSVMIRLLSRANCRRSKNSGPDVVKLSLLDPTALGKKHNKLNKSCSNKIPTCRFGLFTLK